MGSDEQQNLKDGVKIRLINNLNLFVSLQLISHSRLVATRFILHRYRHGHCAKDTAGITTVPLRCIRTTSSTSLPQLFQLAQLKPLTLSNELPFISGICNLWNKLDLPSFPESRSSIHLSNLNLINLILSPSPLSLSLSSHCRDFVTGHRAFSQHNKSNM